jgi:predicted negative regulator of RcsB-dependent stress response
MPEKVQPYNAEAGIAHLGLVLFFVVVVAAAGFTGYRVMNQDKAAPAVSSSSKSQGSSDLVEQAMAGDKVDADQAAVQANKENF